MKQLTDILIGAMSIAIGVAVGTYAYNKFLNK